MNDSQKIHNWLGAGCWHDVQPDGVLLGKKSPTGRSCNLKRCDNCGKKREWSLANPDYNSKQGFWLLLKGLRQKCFGVQLFDDATSNPLVRIKSLDWVNVVEATADTLPLALCAAVEKLIDAESTSERTG